MLHTRHTAPATTARPQLPVWKVLFDRQTALLHRRVAPAVALGVAALGLSRDAPPDLTRLERQLRRETGWVLLPEAAPLDCEDYFAALGARHLPVVTGLRAAVDFERTTPDLFADVFGRLPLLLEPTYAEFLAEMGRLLGQASSARRPALLRFYHATADFGMLAALAGAGAKPAPQVFGARLLTSARHLHAALAAPAPLAPLRDWAQLRAALAAPMPGEEGATPLTLALAA